MRIGVFDSGIGGLTVLKELINFNSKNEYIYVGDTLNIPYGNKSKEELFKLSCNIIDYLINQKVQIIIIACGTISSNLSNQLKSKYKVPIIDIISPTIDYLNNRNYKSVGVIATNMTIKSKIFSNNLKNKKVIEINCPKLVPAIESNNIVEIDNCLNQYLNIFKDNKIDVLVLGCTHYPIVEDKIKNILINTQLLNMAYPITKMINSSSNNELLVTINFTMINEEVINNSKKILNTINYKTNLIVLG